MKLLIITDADRNILGAVRADPVTVGEHTVQAVALPTPTQLHFEVEVDDDFFQEDRRPHEVEEQLRSLLATS